MGGEVTSWDLLCSSSSFYRSANLTTSTCAAFFLLLLVYVRELYQMVYLITLICTVAYLFLFFFFMLLISDKNCLFFLNRCIKIAIVHDIAEGIWHKFVYCVFSNVLVLNQVMYSFFCLNQ